MPKIFHKTISAFQKQSKKTKYAAIECLIFCLVAFTTPLLYFLPVLVNYSSIPNGKEVLIYTFWQFVSMILPFILIILVGTVLFINFRIVFDYKLKVWFYGIMFSVSSMYTFLFYNSAILVANPLAFRPEVGHIYWLLIVFFYPLILNSILLLKEFSAAEKSENFQLRITSEALLLLIYLILAISVGHLEDPEFVREFNLTFLLLVPGTIVLLVMYKFLFQKSVTNRSIAYMPLAVFLVYSFSFQIAPGYPEMLSRSFVLSEYVYYMVVGCVVSFFFMIFVWFVNQIGSKIIQQISKPEPQN
ncbi:hypothetical protein [Methanimicrococcus blatticola]|uniref:Uncharacterized protein n=1 Tax=Methanimicrococcus blatticola TaxID=91560 RepID=A0A484F5R8_9EURY|nr:hypothetical protein [Methanimicrococcus blatticola]MBZ3935300.1 hypothetical protein [Methanimicrococcus blatticola]MCC2508602.1 hypothetical protein [Methanimicrococcus blatticola]TDQ67908.1 hypothetical protein C7391_1462 [Methanimicrococcus blatticola]